MRLSLFAGMLSVSSACSRQCGDLCTLILEPVSPVDMHIGFSSQVADEHGCTFSNGHGWGPSGSLPTQH